MRQRDNFNPILSEARLPLLEFFGAGGHSTGHTALVYLPDIAASDPAEALINRPPTFRQRLSQRYWLFEIDVAHHTTFVTLQLPALEEAFSFTAKVCFTWTVADAAVVARYGIRNTKAIIWRYLDQLLRGISRQFRIEDSGIAEEEMNRQLRKESGDIDYGLRLSLMAVNLHLDQAAQRHLADRVESRRATEIARDEHELQVLREKHTLAESLLQGDLERARARHQRDVELATARHSGELESVTAKHTRELESIKSQHAAELQLAKARQDRAVEEVVTSKDLDLKKQRLKFYRNALEGNSSDVLVLQLIEHPDDIATVVNMLHTDTEISYDRARKVMTELLAQEMVHAADVEPLRQKVVDKLSSALNIAAPQGRVKIAQDRETTVGVMAGDKVVMAKETESTRLTTE